MAAPFVLQGMPPRVNAVPPFFHRPTGATIVQYNLFNSEQFVWGPMGPPPTLKKLQFGEQTGIQSVITSPWVLRWQALPATYNTYRTIRRNPTVALAWLFRPLRSLRHSGP